VVLLGHEVREEQRRRLEGCGAARLAQSYDASVVLWCGRNHGAEPIEPGEIAFGPVIRDDELRHSRTQDDAADDRSSVTRYQIRFWSTNGTGSNGIITKRIGGGR
jgi:hypothetical protein